MCRLFGFRSVIDGQVHQSLVHADNALKTQSVNHPDGWGVAYYISGAPHIVKSTDMAKNSSLFQKVSGVVSSKTVLAHIRKSTIGNINILNTHPFQFGPWVFAHNGNIKGFSEHREEIIKKIDPDLSKFILGDTDSEILFYFLLTYIKTSFGLASEKLELPSLVNILRKSVQDLVDIIGEMDAIGEGSSETFLTFLLTNGSLLIGHQGGKKLYYSTFKKQCPERDTCPKFNLTCENPVQSGKVNHLILSSEPTLSENIWKEIPFRGIIAADDELGLHIDFIKNP